MNAPSKLQLLYFSTGGFFFSFNSWNNVILYFGANSYILWMLSDNTHAQNLSKVNL